MLAAVNLVKPRSRYHNLLDTKLENASFVVIYKDTKKIADLQKVQALGLTAKSGQPLRNTITLPPWLKATTG